MRPSSTLFVMGLCATFQLFFEMDGELGDTHDDPFKRKPHAVSIYISMSASRVGISALCQHACFILVMILLAASSFRSSSLLSFFGVLAWTILTEAFWLGMRARPQRSRPRSKTASLKRLDAECAAWGSRTSLFAPQLSVSERVAYCLGSRWKTYLPRNRTNWWRPSFLTHLTS